MILKTTKILYLFDFDGTLFGDNKWTNFYKTTKSAFKNGPYINPNSYDIRWAIVTGRPKIDKPIVWFICSMNGLYPSKIYTYPAWYHCYTTLDVHQYKENFIKDVLDKKQDIPFQNIDDIERVFYIDNDLDTVRYLNQHRGNYAYQSLTSTDFINNNFYMYL